MINNNNNNNNNKNISYIQQNYYSNSEQDVSNQISSLVSIVKKLKVKYVQKKIDINMIKKDNFNLQIQMDEKEKECEKLANENEKLCKLVDEYADAHEKAIDTVKQLQSTIKILENKLKNKN